MSDETKRSYTKAPVILMLCGLAILIAGALTYANIDEISSALKDINISASPIALIVIGSIVFIIAFYGCCGAIRESHCMIVTFAVFLIVILIAEIAIGVVAFVNRDGWDEQINKSLTDLFNKDYNPDITTNEADGLQRALECCGIKGPRDWENPPYRREYPPISCCTNENVQCKSWDDDKLTFQSGCEEKLREFLKAVGLLLGVLAIVIGIIEITGVIFALCLASSIKNRERRGKV